MKRYLLLYLLAAASLSLNAQSYSLGVEGGFYLIGKGSGKPGFNSVSGGVKGLTATYYPTSRLAINTGVSTTSIQKWSGSRFIRIPLSISYSLTQQGAFTNRKIGNKDISSDIYLYVASHTLELEAGMSMGFYDGLYQNSYNEKQTITLFNDARQTYDSFSTDYNITHRNIRVVPAINMGVKWSIDFNHLHFPIRIIYSILPWGDNKVTIEDVKTRYVVTENGYQAFSIMGGVSYSF